MATDLFNLLKSADTAPFTREEEEKFFSSPNFSKHELISRNLRLVAKIAKEYSSYGVDYEDLVQEGAIGLITAADNYDRTKGAKFSTYAVYWIHHMINHAICNQSRTIRIPNHIYDRLSKVRKMQQDAAKVGKVVTASEVAEKLGLEEQAAATLLEFSMDTISLDADDNEDVSLLEKIPNTKHGDPYAVLEREAEAAILLDVLNTLSEREAIILKMRFGIGYDEPMTLDEVGAQVNLSKERVRQLESAALRKLRVPARKKVLMECLK